jgi:hypothetical protein
MGEGGPPGLGAAERVAILKDFFDIWRERAGRAGNNPDAMFGQNQIMQHRADDVRRIRLLVNGRENSAFENYAPCEDDQMLIEYFVDGTRNAWHNLLDATDVNRENGTTPIDALLVINELTARSESNPTTGELPAVTGSRTALDVDNNLVVSPLDALLVINALPRSNPRSALSGSAPESRQAPVALASAELPPSAQHLTMRPNDLALAQLSLPEFVRGSWGRSRTQSSEGQGPCEQWDAALA